MIKHILAILLISGLAACTTAEKETVSAKDQVAAAAEMCAENAHAMQQRQAKKSLYLRMGEREGIERFSATLYATHKENEKLSHIFGHVPEQPFVKNVTSFVAASSGGGGEYTGRAIPEVHKDMGITHADFLVAGDDIQIAMRAQGLGDNEVQEMICFLVSMVPQVVTR